MSERIQTQPITTQFREHTITFESKEDLMVYAAHFGTFATFVGIYRQAYSTDEGAMVSYQRQLRLKRNQLDKALSRSKVSNGQNLLEFLKGQARK